MIAEGRISRRRGSRDEHEVGAAVSPVRGRKGRCQEKGAVPKEPPQIAGLVGPAYIFIEPIEPEPVPWNIQGIMLRFDW